MSFPISAGVYTKETDNSFIVPASANSIGAIVISSDKGTTGEPKLITSNKEFLDHFGKPKPSHPSMYSALAFLEQGKRLYVVRATNDATVSTAVVDDDAAVKAFDVSAHNAGVWGNSLSVSVTTRISAAAITVGGSGYSVGDILTSASGTGTVATMLVTSVSAGVIDGLEVITSGNFTANPSNPDSVTTNGAGTGATLSYTVSETFTLNVVVDSATVESFEVSRDPLQKNGFGRSMYLEDVVNGQSEYISLKDNVANVFGTAHVAPVVVALTGGANDTVSPTDANINTGWDLFSVKESIEISLLINAGWATPSVQKKMISLCENRKDCFAILDFLPTDNTVTEMINYRQTVLNANTSYAAIYAGYLKIYDQFNDKNIEVAPSGHVAAVYANSAQVSEVWYAPAGSRRGIVRVNGVSKIFTEGERDALYTVGINPIQSFVGQGVQVYGQKTLQSNASATDRVNVRLMLITIEKSIARALVPFVFEFNDTFTRENVSSIINDYMTDIKTRRGVTDYLAVCDESNNTPQVIDTNKMLVSLFVKPTRVAEFIQLNVIITNTGASFTTN